MYFFVKGVVYISCYHPLKMFYLYRYDDANGDLKSRTKIVSADTHHLEMDFQGNWWPVQVEEVGQCKAVAYQHVTIPCGKCIGCRLDYSRSWANRLMLEYKYHKPEACWFCTFTYDNENVPVNYYSDPGTGEALPALTLRKRDMQLFHKNLRNAYPLERIRYFVSGEYGEQTHRPHYHGIYFDLPLDPEKLVIWKRTDQGFTLFECPELAKIWRRGRVLVSSVSWETCAYTARYVTKKLSGPLAEFYKIHNLEPEFSLMSRKPGIARQYFDDHPDCIDRGIHLATDSRGFNFQAPRYFKQIWSLDNQLESGILSLRNSVKQDDLVSSVKSINSLARSDYFSYLEKAEEEKKLVLRNLKRGDV